MIEKAGIPTASVTLIREITERVKPPRALFRDRPFGFPLGFAHDVEEQRRTIEAMLELATRETAEPLIEG